MDKTITIKPNNTYRKTYKMRRVGRWLSTFEASIPPEVVQQYATQEGISIQELLQNYKIEWLFGGGFDGAFMRFIKDNDDKDKIQTKD